MREEQNVLALGTRERRQFQLKRFLRLGTHVHRREPLPPQFLGHEALGLGMNGPSAKLPIRRDGPEVIIRHDQETNRLRPSLTILRRNIFSLANSCSPTSWRTHSCVPRSHSCERENLAPLATLLGL